MSIFGDIVGKLFGTAKKAGQDAGCYDGAKANS